MASERRLHPLSFVFAIVQSAKQFVFPTIFAMFAARRQDAWEVWGGLVLIPLAVVALMRALSVRYRFDATELVIRSGFVFKRVRHIPYDRVQNVDAVQNPLHRLFGVIEVRVETGGGNEAEASLRVVDRSALQEIRERVFAGRQRAATTETLAPAPPPAEVLLRMPPTDVLLFGLIQGRGTIVAGALFGLLWEAGLFDSTSDAIFGPGAGRGVMRQLAFAIFDSGAFPLRQVLLSLVGLVALLVLFRVLSAFWTALRYYGFTLTRSGNDLRCEYGLLTQVASTIPIHRIQKVAVREGPWHRLGGYVSLRVQTAGGMPGPEGSSATAREWLAPLVRRQGIAPLVSMIVPEGIDAVTLQPVDPRGARREFVGSMVLVLILQGTLAGMFGWWTLVLLPIASAWTYFYATRFVAALGWAVSSETIQFARGWIWRTRIVAPLDKVQAVSRQQSPFDRRHRMASVFADTAGGGQASDPVRIPYLPAHVAAAVAQHVAMAAARTTFRW